MSRFAASALDDFLCVFRLAGATFARHQDGLVLFVGHEVAVGVFRNGKDVRRQPLVLAVQRHVELFERGRLVDGQFFVRVDGHQEKTRVRVDKVVGIAQVQVVDDAGLVQVGQFGHVVALVELGRVAVFQLALGHFLNNILGAVFHRDPDGVVGQVVGDAAPHKHLVFVRDPDPVFCGKVVVAHGLGGLVSLFECAEWCCGHVC